MRKPSTKLDLIDFSNRMLCSLGKHIIDKANGASDCINLSAADKLINAQNYAFLGAVRMNLKPSSSFHTREKKREEQSALILMILYRKPTSKENNAPLPILHPAPRTPTTTTTI